MGYNAKQLPLANGSSAPPYIGFHVFAVSVALICSVLLLVLTSGGPSATLAVGLLIGIPGFAYLALKSPAAIVTLLVLGLPFQDVIVQYWDSEWGGIRYWKEALLALLGVVTVLRHLVNFRKLKPLLGSRIFVAACLYAGFCCFRACFARDYIMSMAGLAVVALYFVLLLAAVLSDFTDRQIVIILNAVVLVALIVGFIGILEKLFGFHAVDASKGMYMVGTSQRRFSSTLGSPLSFGQFMAVGASVAFALLIAADKLRQVLFHGACFVVCSSSLLLSYTRGAYLALGIAITVIAFLLYGWRVAEWRSGLLLFACLLSSVVVSVRVVDVSLVQDQMGRFVSISGDRVNRERLDHWDYYAERMLLDPQLMLLGEGWGTTSEHLPGGMPTGNFVTESWALKLIAEGGIFAMLLFYCLYFICLRTGLLVFRKCPKGCKPYVASLLGILTGLGVYSLFLQLFEGWTISMYFWLFTAIICILDRRYSHGPQAVMYFKASGTRQTIKEGKRVCDVLRR